MLRRGFQFAPGYRLQEFLGRGQFGQVWRANAPGGTAAAVKFIDLSDGQGQKEYDGVKRVKQIRHANLMPITAIWLLDGEGKVIEERPDEAMETLDVSVADMRGQSALLRKPSVDPSWLVVSMLLGGKSLQQRLRECTEQGLPGIPPKELISYMDESAKGIDFLNAPQHDLGNGPISIQHSDVKPANIVLIGSSAVVCDFGLARILSRNQVTATSASGTPAYMAPEAIAGKPSRTCDQYSLAVTYYHLRTGMLPVNDGSLWEVLDAHRLGKLKLGLVPEAEQEVLRKATDLDWEKRFDSNVDMVDALREALRVEGHTKVGFVSKSAQVPAPAASGDGQTVAAEGDPTATIDLDTAAPSADQSMEETAPFIQAETPTEGFLKKTLPELEESPRSAVTKTETESGSFVDLIKRNPKVMVGAGFGGVLVLLLGIVALRPSVPDLAKETSEELNRESDEPVVIETDPVPVDPSQLVREAVAMFDTDEAGAVAKLKQALDEDPGLSSEMLEMTEMPGHSGPIMKMLETPDGSSLLTMADDLAPFFWNLADVTQEPIPLSGNEGLILSMAINPKGDRLLAGGYDSSAKVWDLKASDVASSVLELEGHEGDIEAVVWHPTKPIAVTASKDQNLGVWEIGLPDEDSPNGTIDNRQLIPIRETLTSLVTGPDGKWLAARTIGPSLAENKVDVLLYKWDDLINVAGSQPPLRAEEPFATVIAFTKGKADPLLIVGKSDGAISLYETKSGEPVFKTNNSDAHNHAVEAICVVNVDERDFIVTGSAGGSVHWWNYGLTSQSRGRVFGISSIGCVDVSADGRWVAAGSSDGSVWLWDTKEKDSEKGAIQLVTGSGSVDSVLIDVESRWLIAGCGDGAIRMWDLTFAKLLALASPTEPDAKVDFEMKSIDTSKSLTMR